MSDIDLNALLNLKADSKDLINLLQYLKQFEKDPKGWVQCYDRIVWAKDALHAEKLARLYDNDSVDGWKKISLTVTQIDLTDDKELIISSSYRGYD